MKHITNKSSLVYFSICLVLLSFFSCDIPTQEYELIGKWKLENVESGKNLGNTVIALALSSMNDPVFEFKANNEISVISANGNSNISFQHNFKLKNGKVVVKKENGLENELFTVDLRSDTLYLRGGKGFNLTLSRL